MFVRNGEALGSVLRSATPGASADTPERELTATEQEADKNAAEARDEIASRQASEVERPKDSDLKKDWVDYVVAKTADTDSPVSAEEADAMNKADLIELYGGDD